MIALIRKAVLGNSFSIFDRIAVLEKSSDAIVWREVSETAEELKKFDCIVVSDRGLGGVMLEEQINIVFDMNLTGLWIATPNGLHQARGFDGKFIPWKTSINDAYYGQLKERIKNGEEEFVKFRSNGMFYGIMFQLWDGIVYSTNITDLVSKAAQ